MLNLTRRERFVVAFLIVSFIVGCGIRLYKTRNSSQNVFSQLKEEKKKFKKEVRSQSDSTLFSQQPESNKIDSSKKGQNDEIQLYQSTKEDFMTISGIGPVTAERIINYREKHKSIQSIQELINIKGIGTKTIKKIKNEVTIE